MKKLILTLTTLIIAISMFAQNKLPDNGISNETHRKNIGKVLFSKTEVLFNKEHLNKWTNTFNWGDPIYARMYWAEGINNIYQKNNWQKPADTYRYVLRFYANGKLFKEHIVQTKGGRTSLPLCLYPDPKDTYQWSEMNILSNNLNKFKAGNNIIKVEICAYNRANNRRSEPLSSGTFTLNVPQSSIAKANQTVFTKIETRYTPNEEWNDWEIGTKTENGKLISEWKRKDQWTFTLSGIKGKIETRYRNDFSSWILNTGNTKIYIEPKYRNDWKIWIITHGNDKLKVETRYNSGNDAWQQWIVSGNSGKMNINTRYRDKDAWKQWIITDNMPTEKAEMKMAAIFIVIFQAISR